MRIKNIKKILRGIAGLCLGVVIIINFTGCGNEEQQIDPETATSKIGVMLKDRSYIRLDPVLYSTVVAYTKLGEKVSILDQSRDKTWIGNTSDYWYKIKNGGGLTGWTFGTNLKIFSDKDSGDIKDFLKELWKNERSRLLSKLTGRWWSVDNHDNFTNQCVEIHNDGEYKAYCTNCGEPIEGEYTIKYRTNEIIFSKGTQFGDRVNYIMRGDAYILKKAGQDGLKFKRIKRKFDDAESEEKPEDKDAKPDPDK